MSDYHLTGSGAQLELHWLFPIDLHLQESFSAIQDLLPVELGWGMLNFSNRRFQWQFWGKCKSGPIKKVRQTECRLLRNSTFLASDPDLHVNSGPGQKKKNLASLQKEQLFK